MKSLVYPIFLLFPFLFGGCSEEPDLKPLFNGKDLTGWTYSEEACWEVKDGILHARNDPEQKGDILLTVGEYTDFVFQVDFRFGEGRIDSGIFIRDTKEQIQIGDSGLMKRDMTALPYIPGKGYPVQVETAQSVLNREGWNTLKVKVTGNRTTTWLNGTEIMTYESDTIVPSGPIGLQVHPNRQMTLDFRNILLAELP